MAKRSPILGYNHNVRYRGLIFHVQTEDSGVLSPHLFTHLFHTGVIVSTRKLVYDAGSDEGAIKSLMQAQHKAVMKDLKRGTFDDKIDQYLGGTPGLLPRGFAEPDLRESQPVLARPSDPGIPQPSVEDDPPSEPMIVIEAAGDSEPIELIPTPPAISNALTVDMSATLRTPMIDPADINQTLKTARAGTEPTPPLDLEDELALGHFDPAATKPQLAPRAWLEDPAADARHPMHPHQARTKTADRGSGTSIRTSLPPAPSADLDGPTSLDGSGSVAAAIAAQNNATIRTPIPRDMPRDFDTPPSVAEIIQLELDPEPSKPRSRTSRDTDVQAVESDLQSDGVPGYTTAPPETPRPRANESVPPLPPPPASSRVGASALPPARPITRPPARPAITAPQVVSRPITRDSDRPRQAGDSDSIEVYAPAPPSAETPPGIPERERPGQYSQHSKRTSGKMPAIDATRERSGAVPIPPGLGRPGNARVPTGSNPTVPRPAGQPPPIPREAIPQAVRGETSSGIRGSSSSGGVPRARTPTPSRSSPPMSSRTNSPSVPNSGVVMTRPAVIVGAPAKPAQPSRVRKAREDEGRGFGQGLISEKSLDEVILAYLSEDADDK